MTYDEYIKKIMAIGGFAFPVDAAMPEGGTYHCAGMTLRDYFAAQALAVLLGPLPRNAEFGSFTREIANAAYVYADAMLEARK